MLADHQFTYAAGQLRTSVDSLCEIIEGLPGRKDAVKYTGPTFVNIRSTLHTKGNAVKHLEDWRRMITECPEDAKRFIFMPDESVRPIWMFQCDAGPDHCCRNEATIASFVAFAKFVDADWMCQLH